MLVVCLSPSYFVEDSHIYRGNSMLLSLVNHFRALYRSVITVLSRYSGSSVRFLEQTEVHSAYIRRLFDVRYILPETF